MAAANLLEFLSHNRIPKSRRDNVSDTPVSSLTVGCTQRRIGGFGVSSATRLFRGRLTRLLLALPQDPLLLGERPLNFTSACLNVDYAAGPHTDKHNDGDSFVIGLGAYTGGELFYADGRGETVYPGSALTGSKHDIRYRFFRFSGKTVHAVLPFTGFRVSVVFFGVPLEKAKDGNTAVQLASLGFPVPHLLKLPYPHFEERYLANLSFHIFICTTRRSKTIAKDTLAVLFADRSLSFSVVTLCLRDREDAESYSGLPFAQIVLSGEGGLAEQREECLRGRPTGSWNFFVDDDIKKISFFTLPVAPADETALPAAADITAEGEALAPEDCRTGAMTIRDLIVFGFLTARSERVKLWGLNTSGDTRNLRDTISRRLGLVNGYCFGIIKEDLRPALPLSTAEGGACEDVERSIRYGVNFGGMVRLNFATAEARTRTNSGGLQEIFASRAEREQAHARVLSKLIEEFPGHLKLNPKSPNGCAFLWKGKECGDVVEEADADDFSDVGAEQQERKIEDDDAKPTKRRRAKHAGGRCSIITPPLAEAAESPIPPLPPPPPTTATFACSACPKRYTRKEALDHHFATAHADTPAVRVGCPKCGRAFLKKKDALTHYRARRCFTKRGKYTAVFVE